MGEPVRIGSAGDDGSAHVTYYDADTTLSFTWSGVPDDGIEVAHGGYGEPMLSVLSTPSPSGDVLGALAAFERRCREYVTEWKRDVGTVLDAHL